MKHEAEQEAWREAGGQFACLLGFSDHFDLTACEADSQRVGLSIRAFQALPGADADDLGPTPSPTNSARPSTRSRAERIRARLVLRGEGLDPGDEEVDAEAVVQLRFEL
jgi:hypothetical protein